MTSDTDTYIRIGGEDYPLDSTEAQCYLEGIEEGQDNHNVYYPQPPTDSMTDVIAITLLYVSLFEFLVILSLL